MATNVGMIRTLFGIWRRLPQRLRSRLAWLAALGLAASMAQLAVVACIALLGTCLASPDKAYGLPGMDLFREFFPFMASAPGTLLATLSLGTVAVVGTNNALRALNEYLSVRISREVERHIGGALLEGFLRMPYEWFLRGNSSDLVLNIYWASHYATVARMAVTLISEVASTLLILAGVFFLAPGFALAAMMFTGLLSVVLFRMLRRKLDKYSKLYRETTLERQRLLNVAMQGVKDVKVFHSEASLGRWCDELMQRSVSYAASQELARSAPAFLLEPLGFAIIMSVVAFLALGDAPSSRILGTASLMVAAGWKILPCVNKILTAVVSMRTSWPFLLKCEEDLAHVAENDARAEKPTGSAPGQTSQGFRDGLELKGVGFRYEGADEPSLCGFDLAIRKGEVVGIVGRSGAGKSTLVNVLAGLLLPSGGDMRVDGRALCAEDARRWKAASIGYVPQAPYIFDATLAENVAFGLRGAEIDRDRVLECCRMAAMDFLDDLPQGLDARIGERGLRLSGGQQQRVAIARALYKDPDIILFDEATSSLDPKSEQQILQTIYGLKGRKTMILVAHRLTTVEGCDRVCWVEQGRVRMEGSPAEVLPSYAALWLAPGADQ